MSIVALGLVNVIPEGLVVTFTVHVAILPFAVFAVIVAVPLFTAVTFPFTTIATPVLLLLHVISLLRSEFVGLIVP